MAQATIDLGLNTASFTAGLNEAERKSQSFEGRIAGLFRRSPLQRAERAFGELGANLATGNVAQGLASFVGRITGLGLITGAAVGAAIGVFQKFRGEITETTKAANELDKALAISGYATSAAQAGKSIDAISSSIDALSKKSKGIGATAFGIISPGFKKGLKDEIDAALAEFSRLEAQRPKAEARQTGIQAESLMGSQREADLAAIRLDKEEKIADIRARQTIEADKALESLGKADPETRMKALTAIQKSAEASIFNVEAAAALQEKKANDIYDLKSKELDIEKNIAAQALLEVSAEDQKISRLKQQLALIQEQLKAAADRPERRKELETAQTKTKAQLDEALKARGVVVPPSIEGSTPAGIYDPNLGGYRTAVRPQEQANLRNYQAEAADRLRSDYADYNAKMREYQANVADYLRGADYYSPEQLKHPNQPGGYSVDPLSGQLHGYDIDWKTGQYMPRSPGGGKAEGETTLTKEEFQAAMDAVMGKYWGN